MRARSCAAVLLATAGLWGTLEGHRAGADERATRVEGRLPWPIFVGTSEGRFLIRRTGDVARLSHQPWRPQQHVRRGWIRLPGGSFGHVRGGHVVVTRAGKTLWESATTFRLGHHAKLWDLSLGNFGLTFQVTRHGPLYASAGGCPEVRIGTGLSAEGITRSGRVITLRGRTGTFQSWQVATGKARTLASRLPVEAIDASYFDRRTSTFLYWTRTGQLRRTDGVHTRLLANYHSLGFLRQPSMSLLHGGLMELLSRTWREVVLDPDGTVFARLKVRSDGSVTGFGDQVADRWGDVVAYVLTPSGQSDRSRVYLLRSGATRGTLFYTGPSEAPCAIAASWHDHWLLFAPHGGRGVLLDATRRLEPVHLTSVLRGLPGQTRQVRWAYQLQPRAKKGAAARTD